MTNGKWCIRLMPPSLSPWTPKKAPSKGTPNAMKGVWEPEQIVVLMSGGVDSSVLRIFLRKTAGMF